MQTIKLPTISLAVDDHGHGPPVLFVHGFPLNHSMWHEQRVALEATHRVLVPDLRGFGASQVTPGKVTMAQLADDCAALLDALQINERITFVGLSMGGYVAWQFVERHASRLGKLVVCDTRAVGDTPAGIEGRLKMADHVLKYGTSALAEAMLPKLFAAATATRHPQVVSTVREMMLAAPPEGVAAAQRGMAERPDMTGLLPRIRVPTLVICGAEDTISPPDEMRQIAALIPGARFELIPAAGHLAPLENPMVVNQAMRAFLSES